MRHAIVYNRRHAMWFDGPGKRQGSEKLFVARSLFLVRILPFRHADRDWQLMNFLASSGLKKTLVVVVVVILLLQTHS